MSKMERMIAMIAGVAGIAAAIYTLRKPASAATAAPPSTQLYNAQNNPNGYVYMSGRGWVRTTPNGVDQYYSNELFSDGVS